MKPQMKRYDWLFGRVTAVGRCFGAGYRIAKLIFLTKWLITFETFNHRPTKFGMGVPSHSGMYFSHMRTGNPYRY